MKKNILLVPSLLALSLAVTTPASAMEIQYKEKPTSQGNRKKRRQAQQKNTQNIQRQIVEDNEHYQIEQDVFAIFTNPLYNSEAFIPSNGTKQETQQQEINRTKSHFQSTMEELQSSRLFIQQSQLNNVLEVVENPLYNSKAHIPSNLVQSETEVIDVTLPEQVTNNNTNDNLMNLNQSVILPTAKKELTLWEKLSYHTSTANQILQQVIASLELNQFDATDKRSFDLLEEAIATATKNNDIASLAKMAALCQEKYPTTIRISNQTAQAASQALNSHYSAELTLANDKLQNKHEEKMKQWNMATATCMASIINAISTYKQNIGVIYKDYNTSLDQEAKNIAGLSRDLNRFSSLNRDIRPSTLELLTKDQLVTPKNIHTNTMSIAENKFNSILTTIEKEIPTTKELQKNPTYLEALTNKCLTNK